MTQVVPVYYCTFTLMSIIGGMMVYNELGSIDTAGGILFGCGVLLAFGGVALLMSGHAPTTNKPKKVSRKDLDTVASEAIAVQVVATSTAPATNLSPKSAARASRAASWIEEKVLAKRPSNAAPGGGDELEVREISFRELEIEDKIVALDHQPSASHLPFGGSLVQAASDTLLGSGRDTALLMVESANFPNNLDTAKRLKEKGRLQIGAVASALFGTSTSQLREVASSAGLSPRRRVDPLKEPEEGEMQSDVGPASASAAQMQL